jgi:RHS repeat-associated protein
VFFECRSTSYFLDGGAVIGEDTDGREPIFYHFDEAGNRVGLMYEWFDYWYIFNGQGDVIGLVDETGEQVVEYLYDSWGKVISVTGPLADTVGQANPIRYRGYYWDAETGLFYVGSRYYDPTTGRFINADATEALGLSGNILSTNMFAYCNNNPMNLSVSSAPAPKSTAAVSQSTKTDNDLYNALVKNGSMYGYYWNGTDGGAHLIVITGVNLTKGIVYTNNPWGFAGEQTYRDRPEDCVNLRNGVE